MFFFLTPQTHSSNLGRTFFFPISTRYLSGAYTLFCRFSSIFEWGTTARTIASRGISTQWLLLRARLRSLCSAAGRAGIQKPSVSGVSSHLQPCAKRSRGKAEVLWASVGEQQRWTRGFPSWFVDWQSWTPGKERPYGWVPDRGHRCISRPVSYFPSPLLLVWEGKDTPFQQIPTQSIHAR